MRSVMVPAAAVLVVLGQPLAAEEAAPDQEVIDLPEMTFATDPDVAKNGYKFFFHHNAEISFDLAFRDFSECLAQLPTQSFLQLPSFVPWEESSNREVVYSPNMYGIVGEVMSMIISPKFERGVRNNKMRLCLERRGYVRYAIDEDAYDAIWEGPSDDVAGRLAKLATMQAPDAPQVPE